MQNRTRVRAAILVAVTASALLVGGNQLGHAGEAPTRRSSSAGPTDAVPAGFTTWAEVFAVQDRLNAAARRIVAAGGAGYAGIVAAPANREVRVYWKGSVPAPVRDLSGRLGVPVRFLPARYTDREMLAEARRLAADPAVLSVAPEVDGSGLSVVTARPLPTVSAQGMPLHARTGSASQQVSRPNDSSPYWGGAKFKTIFVNGCTFGFSIFYNGLPRMLTAAHCGAQTAIVWDGAGDLIGDVTVANVKRDVMMVDTRIEGETFGPVIYTGPFDSNTSAPVSGATEDFVGNLVCTGGARTGEHCGIEVTAVNATDSAGTFPLVVGERTEGCAVARGDSGGPVYHYDGGQVVGRGIISSAALGTASCPNAQDWESSRLVRWAPLLRPAGESTVGALQAYRGARML